MAQIIIPGTAVPGDVLTGDTFSAGTNYNATGTMPNRNAGPYVASSIAAWGNGDIAVYHGLAGYYGTGAGGSEMKVTLAQLQGMDGNFIASNIKKGTSMLGVTGTYSIPANTKVSIKGVGLLKTNTGVGGTNASIRWCYGSLGGWVTNDNTNGSWGRYKSDYTQIGTATLSPNAMSDGVQSVPGSDDIIIFTGMGRVFRFNSSMTNTFSSSTNYAAGSCYGGCISGSYIYAVIGTYVRRFNLSNCAFVSEWNLAEQLHCIRTDTSGNLYVLAGSKWVKKFDSSMNLVWTYSNTSLFGAAYGNGSLAVKSDGSAIYCADGSPSTLNRVNSSGSFVNSISIPNAPNTITLDEFGNVLLGISSALNKFAPDLSSLLESIDRYAAGWNAGTGSSTAAVTAVDYNANLGLVMTTGSSNTDNNPVKFAVIVGTLDIAL